MAQSEKEQRPRSNSLLVQFYTATAEHFTGWDKWMGLLLLASSVVTFTAHFADNELYAYRGFGFIAVLAAYLLMVFRPMIKMGQQRHKQLAVLTAWAIIGFFVLLTCLILAFFSLADLIVESQQPFGSAPGTVGVVNGDLKLYERLIFVPPVIAAIWAAGFGWLISYQSAMKTQRTAHAVAFSIQLLTNSEIIGRQDKLRRAFPPGEKIKFDAWCLGPERHKRLPIARLEFEAAKELEEKKKLLAEIHTMEAVDALRSILNQYEFMAVGIKQGDLDEDILYETVSPAVRSVWEQSEPFRKYVHECTNVLAWEHLASLLERWCVRLDDEEHEAKKRRGK